MAELARVDNVKQGDYVTMEDPKVKVIWTPEKEEKAKILIEEWLEEHDCYSGEFAQQSDECVIDAIGLIGELADLLVTVV